MRLSPLAACLWTGANLPALARYSAALQHPWGVQERLLRRYLRENAGTAFGRAHGFDAIRTVTEFQLRVPLARWPDVAPWVDRIAAGEPGVLTRSPVRVLEPTAGSTAGKRIPYTAALQRELRRAVGPWIVDLVRQHPALAWGRSYWAITPVLADRTPAVGSKVRVGFEEDAEYLGGRFRRLVGATLAVPSALRLVGDLESFRYLTLRFLLQAADLALVSVWHPSFLTLLLDALPRHWDRLLQDVAEGRLTPPEPIADRLHAVLASAVRPSRRRAAALSCLDPSDPTRIWPRLCVVSCWGDAHAALHVPALQRALPGVRVQAKGLLATEACVSLPFAGKKPLAIASHFFEFLEDGGRARRAHELEHGGVYSVVVTTGGGLYRYCLEDRVEVDGFVGRTPSLRFLGKEGHVSDLVGEKLREDFVAGALARVFAELRLEPRFALVAPRSLSGRPGYVLYLEVDAPVPPALPSLLERTLEENGGYRYALALGQLAPVAVARIADGLGAYLRRCQELGQRLGSVKPLALSPRDGWDEVFATRG